MEEETLRSLHSVSQELLDGAKELSRRLSEPMRDEDVYGVVSILAAQVVLQRDLWELTKPLLLQMLPENKAGEMLDK